MDRRWILGGVLLAGGVGVARVLTHRPRFTYDSRILLIGDSFATGISRHLQTFASEENLPFISAALIGTTCAQWADSDWLLRKLDEFEPSHVLISLGTNDAYSSASPHTVSDDAEDINELLQGHHAHPIWIGPPALPPNYGGLVLQKETLLAIQETAPYYYKSSDLDIPRGPDGLHPTAVGYAGWAAMIWNWLS